MRMIYSSCYGTEKVTIFQEESTMKKDEFKKWVREHKKGILIGVAVAAAAGTCGFLHGFAFRFGYLIKAKDVPHDLIKIGDIERLVDCGSFIEGHIWDVSVKDLGSFGEELIGQIPDLTKDTKCDFVIDLKK